MARTFGAPDTVPAGKPAASASIASRSARELALDVRDDVHDMAVALDEELSVTLTVPIVGDAADVVAAEIEQHQMLGALLGIGEQFVFQRLVFVRRLAARARAGDGPDRDDAVARPHQDFRAGADDGETGEIEVVQKRRRIEPPQRAIERERRQRERRGEALASTTWNMSPAAMYSLASQHHRRIFVGRGVGLRRARRAGRRRLGRRLVERPLEAVDDGGQPLDRACKRRLASTPLRGRTGVTTVIASFTASNTIDHGRPHQDRVGHADRIGLGGAKSSISRTMS